MLRGGSDLAGYYLSRQANCPAGYYLGPEPAGRWLGAGAAAAGHSGWLDAAGADALRSYLAGKSPDGKILAPPLVRADPRGRLGAKPLVDAVQTQAAQQGVPPVFIFTEPADRAAWTGLEARVDRVRRGRPTTVSPDRARQLADAAGLDVAKVYMAADGSDRYAAAARFASKRIDARRPGIDVTISAPKSVSVLFGLGDAKTAAAVRDAHRTAVGDALAYLEAQAGHGLRGHQGDGQRADRIRTDGWIVAAFEHHTSRTGDPQLHTHLVVPNLLHGADGKWSAIDSKAVYRNALTASYVYQAVLRGELTRRLGVAWTAPVKGVAEIAGMPGDLLRAFSTRRQQIERAMADAGATGPEAAQAACLATRPAKPAPESPEELRGRWMAQASAAGHIPGQLIQSVLGRGRVPTAPPVDELAQHLLGPAGLTAHATGFDRRDLLQALCQALPAGLPVDRQALEAVADRVLRHRDVVRLVTGGDHAPRWSTAELLAVEQHGLRVAAELRSTPRLATVQEDEGKRAGNLTPEQRDVAEALSAATGLAVVVGPAGSGKTATVAAAVQEWIRQGRPVVGGAVAAVTARRLEHATGVQSSSLARLLHAARATGASAVPAGGVLVVDEASMVDTRTFAALLAQATAVDGTLVLVGDPAQLPEIGAGGLFAALARHEDTLVLTDNQRQAEDWERRALADLRAGDPDAALDAYARHGRVHSAPVDRLVEQLVDDYLRPLGSAPAHGAAGVGERVVMLAVRRSDVAELNDAVRQRLISDGRLGEQAITVGTDDQVREYRVGDKVLVRANDHRRRLLNGTRAEVTSVDPGHATLTLRPEVGLEQTVPVAWAAHHLDHGYAMTCHKAQGATVEVALVYAGGGLTREAGYVALSRGRVANHLYVPDLAGQQDTLGGGRDGLDVVAARLSARRTQVLATRQLPRRTPAWTSLTTRAAPSVQAEGISR